MRAIITVFFFLAPFAFEACSTSSVPAPTATPTFGPSPSATPGPNLYVTLCAAPHVLDVFKPPMSGSSSPAITVAWPGQPTCALSGAVLSGHMLALGTNQQGVYIYQLPLADKSSPVAQLGSIQDAGGLVQDSSGKLIVADSDFFTSGIDVYTPPFMTNSQPTASFLVGQGQPFILQMNAAGLLFAGLCGTNGLVMVYTPPITASTTPTAQIAPPGATCTQGIGLDRSGNLYVADALSNTVWIYQPPFTSASTPTTTIAGGPSGTSGPLSFAFDRLGNIYIADGAAGAVLAYAPPLTATSKPLFTIHTEGSPQDIFFGP